MRCAHWENIIFISVLTLFLAGPVWGDGMTDAGPADYTDYGAFLGEYQAAGALKFYDNTEDALRMAQFETALMRYRFLKGQIQRKVDYRGLVNMVDLRLRFLKRQMHLTNRDIAAIPPRKVRIPKPKPPETKDAGKKDQATKPKTLEEAAKEKQEKDALTIPGMAPPAAPAAPGAAGAQKLPDVVTTTPESKEQKAEDAEEKKQTKKALSVWDKLRLRLNLTP